MTDGPPAPALPVSSVARRLGVAPATLRTWDRRYGVGPTEHAHGAHRRYSPHDVARLEVMQRLLHQGVPPREAARHALEGAAAPEASHALAPPPTPPPGAEEAVRGMGRAAQALDGASVRAGVRDQVRLRGVVGAWDDVLRPVLAAAGEHWAQTGKGVDVEHLLSDAVAGALQAVLEEHPVRDERVALLASAPDEQHALPLHVLAAALAESGAPSRVLGAALPADALVDAVRRTAPAALFLWSQLPPTADTDVLAGLPRTRPRTDVVVGGPGWDGVELPPRVLRADSLGTAVSLVLASLGH